MCIRDSACTPSASAPRSLVFACSQRSNPAEAILQQKQGMVAHRCPSHTCSVRYGGAFRYSALP
eukprot:13200622-Alexandrium_andersonii.AAC.1